MRIKFTHNGSKKSKTISGRRAVKITKRIVTTERLKDNFIAGYYILADGGKYKFIGLS